MEDTTTITKTNKTKLLEEALSAEYNRGYQDGLEKAISIYQTTFLEATSNKSIEEGESIGEEENSSSRASKGGYRVHRLFWQKYSEDFVAALHNGATVQQMIDNGAKYGLTQKAVLSKAYRSGFGYAGNTFYKRGDM
jgi:hypothetical protein